MLKWSRSELSIQASPNQQAIGNNSVHRRKEGAREGNNEYIYSESDNISVCEPSSRGTAEVPGTINELARNLKNFQNSQL